jgi:hypothetical protein
MHNAIAWRSCAAKRCYPARPRAAAATQPIPKPVVIGAPRMPAKPGDVTGRIASEKDVSQWTCPNLSVRKRMREAQHRRGSGTRRRNRTQHDRDHEGGRTDQQILTESAQHPGHGREFQATSRRRGAGSLGRGTGQHQGRWTTQVAVSGGDAAADWTRLASSGQKPAHLRRGPPAAPSLPQVTVAGYHDWGRSCRSANWPAARRTAARPGRSPAAGPPAGDTAVSRPVAGVGPRTGS